MKPPHTIRNIVATVVGGLIVAAVLQATDNLLTVWSWIKTAFSAVVAVLTYPVNIPVWLLVLALAVIAGLIIGIRNLPDKGTTIVPAPQDELSDLERSIIRALVAADDRPLRIEELNKATRETRIRLQHALDLVYQKDLIVVYHNYVYGNSYRLSDAGRTYAITNCIA